MRKNLKGSDKNDPRLYLSLSRESKRTIPASLLSTECLSILLNEICIILRVKIPALLCSRFGLQIFYSKLFYSINNTLQQSLEQLQLFGIILKNPSFVERQAGQRFSFLGLFQQPHQV